MKTATFNKTIIFYLISIALLCNSPLSAAPKRERDQEETEVTLENLYDTDFYTWLESAADILDIDFEGRPATPLPPLEPSETTLSESNFSAPLDLPLFQDDLLLDNTINNDVVHLGVMDEPSSSTINSSTDSSSTSSSSNTVVTAKRQRPNPQQNVRHIRRKNVETARAPYFMVNNLKTQIDKLKSEEKYAQGLTQEMLSIRIQVLELKLTELKLTYNI